MIDQGKFHRFVEFIFALILGFVPLLFSFKLNLAYELPKIMVFRILVEISLLVLLIKFLMLLRVGLFPSIRDLLANRFFVWVLSIWIVISLSQIGGLNLLTGLLGNYDKRFGLITLSHLFFFSVLTVILTKSTRNQRWIELALRLVVPVSIFINFYISFRQLYMGDLDLSLTEGRAIGTFGQANFLSSFALFGGIFSYYFFKSSRALDQKLWFLGALASSGVLVLWAQSRVGYILAVVLISALIFLRLYRYVWNRKKLVKMIWLGGLLVVTFSAIFFVVKFSPRFRDNGILDPMRPKIWQAAVEMIKQRPLNGYGLDTYGYIFPKFLYEQGISTPYVIDRAHSEVLDIALGSGLIVLGMYAITLILIIKKLWLAIINRSLESQKYWLITNLVVFCMIAINSLVNVLGIFEYIVLAFSIGVMGSLFDTRINYEQIKHSTRLVVVSALSFCVLIALWCFGSSLSALKADYYYRGYVTSGRIDYLRQAVKYEPYQIRYRLDLFAYEFGSKEFDIQEVFPYIFIKQKLNPSQYYFLLGEYYEGTGNIDLARQSYKVAHDIDPARDEYKEKIKE